MSNMFSRFNKPEQKPLSLDVMRRDAPSIFATRPYPAMSSRYSFIPTVDVVENMMAHGFLPFSATQSSTRIADKQEFTKHMVRFRYDSSEAVTKVGQLFPEVVLINSFDGSSAYKMMAGIFRLVCSNGLIVADSLQGSVNIRHTGNVLEDVRQGAVEIVEHMPKTIDAIDRWKQIQLAQPERLALASAAHELRFPVAEGGTPTPIQPDQLLTTRRYDDQGNDLWTTFNTVQENVIQGGLTARGPSVMTASGRRQRGRRVTTRGINGIDQDVKLNKALWTLAEALAKYKSEQTVTA